MLGNVWEWTSSDFMPQGRMNFIKKFGTKRSGTLPETDRKVDRTLSEKIVDVLDHMIEEDLGKDISIRGGNANQLWIDWGVKDPFCLKLSSQFHRWLGEKVYDYLGDTDFLIPRRPSDTKCPWTARSAFRIGKNSKTFKAGIRLVRNR